MASAVGSEIDDGMVVLDLSYRSIAIDRGAEAIFGSLAKNGNADGPVPREILSFLQASPSPDGDDVPMYVSAFGRQYTCRRFLLRSHNGSEPLLTLYLKREVSLLDAAHHMAVEYHLTDREEEALIGLAMGLSSKEVASRMKISPNTVKAFIRLAMIKMGARSRASVFAKLLDHQAG